jgi:UDP-N-acetylmuramoyl-tripeptide--D-alanyl-D-alanine ligase
LQELARNVLSEFNVRVVGITGSVGKTTTKVFLSSLLSAKYNVLQSEGNFNNHIGLPISLLKLTKAHEVAVFEMAMNAPGEILALTRIAKPDYAVIMNIKPVHIEFFDSIQDIALAKKEILDGMDPEGTVVINGDDPLVKEISSRWKGKKISFGFSPKCDIQAQNIKETNMDGIEFDLKYGMKSRPVLLQVFYKSYLMNFLAAAGVAFALSLSMEEIHPKTNELKPLSMRGDMHRLKNGIILIDDSYNSNPFALESVLTDLSSIPCQRRLAILGDMLELGKDSVTFHREAGKRVHETGWDHLVTVGPLSQHLAEGARLAGLPDDHVLSFMDSEEAAENLNDIYQKGDLVLVKGSRGIQMEIIVEKMKSKGL